MALELKQQMKLSQQLVMTPQLQQAIKLLQLSRMELVDLVREEMEQNPLLEDSEGEEPTIDEKEIGEASLEAEALPPPEAPESQQTEEVKGDDGENKDIDWEQYLESYQTLGQTAPSGKESNSDDLPSFEATLTRRTTLVDHLAWQVGLIRLSEEEQRVAALILGSIDDDGYFRIEGFEGDPTIRIAQEAGASTTCAERVLRRIQELDPLGVASRDLEECLLIQARYLGVEDGLVGIIIKRHLKQLESRNLPAIAKELALPLEEVVAAVRIISNLEPKPGRIFAGEDPQYITPDVYVHKVGDKYMTVLNDDGLSKLRISATYRNALRAGMAGGKAKEFIIEKLRSAQWLIRSIHQRQRTIHKVTESIVKFQRDFLDKGISHLKPLILRDVAEDIGMHESTVSRVTTNKYVHTPQGIYELKFFFNSSIAKTGGDEIASEAVKNHIKQIVAGENPKSPYSDQKIVEILRSQGIEIARRTVAKYRDVLGILPSSKRKSYL
ncbi:MAG TPA: RNA polymerase sigma-54 factor [Myxococcales bacterium]|jgi:RNA polymerase sigma-54 factor|nr:RNA polymerase sigma-54 factor [Myxococcales bacterium]